MSADGHLPVLCCALCAVCATAVFWDCEMWSWPALLPGHPDLAAAALKYRKQRLGQARVKASYYGWGGTMFPWESAAAGGDMCPCSGKGNNREHPPRSENSMEIHINSECVARHPVFASSANTRPLRLPRTTANAFFSPLAVPQYKPGDGLGVEGHCQQNLAG